MGSRACGWGPESLQSTLSEAVVDDGIVDDIFDDV